jgi:hypothetical protein
LDDVPEDDSSSDEINREDGLLRHWMFYNGEWAETIFGLAAGIGFIFWCFLYILGYGTSLLGYILIGVAAVGFAGWRLIWSSLSEYQSSGWRKGRSRSSRVERSEVFVAAFLWLFIFISIGIIPMLQWRRPH